MKSFTITLPLPPRKLHPNGRCGWQEKSRLVSSYRSTAAMVARLERRNGVIAKPLKAAEIRVTLFNRTRHRHDADNVIAWLKAGFDGLVDGGILADDRDVTHLPPLQDTDATDPRVEMEIRFRG